MWGEEGTETLKVEGPTRCRDRVGCIHLEVVCTVQSEPEQAEQARGEISEAVCDVRFRCEFTARDSSFLYCEFMTVGVLWTQKADFSGLTLMQKSMKPNERTL